MARFAGTQAHGASQRKASQLVGTPSTTKSRRRLLRYLSTFRANGLASDLNPCLSTTNPRRGSKPVQVQARWWSSIGIDFCPATVAAFRATARLAPATRCVGLKKGVITDSGAQKLEVLQDPVVGLLLGP